MSGLHNGFFQHLRILHKKKVCPAETLLGRTFSFELFLIVALQLAEQRGQVYCFAKIKTKIAGKTQNIEPIPLSWFLVYPCLTPHF